MYMEAVIYRFEWLSKVAAWSSESDSLPGSWHSVHSTEKWIRKL